MKGDMRLDIMDRGKLRQIPIKEGEIFLLPGCIPHSPQVRLSAQHSRVSRCACRPQRFADTVGLVIERERDPTEIDGLRWYVGNTDEVLYEEYFHCTDLGVQLVPVIERFMASDMYKSGKPDPHAPPPSHTVRPPGTPTRHTLTTPHPVQRGHGNVAAGAHLAERLACRQSDVLCSL